MNEPRWMWPLVTIALVLILISTISNGGWVLLGGLAAILGAAYACIQLATRHGYEYRMRRGTGLVALPVMFVVVVLAFSITRSIDLSWLLAAAAAEITLLAVGLKRAPQAGQ